MVSLRTFLFLVSATLLVGAFAFFSRQSHRIVGKGFQESDAIQRQTVAYAAQSILSAKRYSLQVYASSLENDVALAEALLLAKEQNGKAALTGRLKAIEKETGCDVAEVIYHDGTHFGTATLPAGHTVAKRFFADRVSQPSSKLAMIAIDRVDQKPFLVSYSQLRHFGETVGVLVLGYSLDQRLAKQVSEVAQSEVMFRIRDDPSASLPPGTLSLDLPPGINGPGLSVVIENRLLPGIRRSTNFGINWIGGLSFLFVLILLFLVLEIGFVRRFRFLVAAMRDVACGLDRDLIIDTEIPNSHPLSEVSQLGSAFRTITESLRKFRGRIEEKSKAEATYEIAQQVAHDLKSPISALQMLIRFERVRSLPEAEQTLILRCLERIREIAAVLQSRRQDPSPPQEYHPSQPQLHSLLSLVEPILEEKRAQYFSRENLQILGLGITGQRNGPAFVEPVEFRRCLSNLIDNSVQAIPEGGQVKLSLIERGEFFELQVIDNGRGIPSWLIPHLGVRGKTHGKSGGQGLGLAHARECCESWGGELKIQSTEGKGTTVSLLLSRSSARNRSKPTADSKSLPQGSDT